MTENPVPSLVAGFQAALRGEWKNLVSLACTLVSDAETVKTVSQQISEVTGKDSYSIQRKIHAIQYAKSNLNYSEEEIVAFGESKTLSLHQQSKKTAMYESLVSLTFKIPGSQKEIAQQHFDRVKKLLNLTTSESLIDWVIAQIHNASDEDILKSVKHE